MENNLAQQIGIIVIIFHPTEDQLYRIRILSEHYPCVVIDNTPTAKIPKDALGHAHYIPLGRNMGIAKAQNEGYRWFLKDQNIQYFILLDQDSHIDSDYPIRMVSEYISVDMPNLAALGPTVIRYGTHEVYRSAFYKEKILPEGIILKDEIIASGCCVTRAAICQIGLNDESLFIDFVDCEWCFRAKAKGWICAITPNIKMFHQVGNHQKHLGRHIIIISAPFRYYYQYRNLIILNTRSYVPWQFKRNKSIKAALRFLYFPFVIKNGATIWWQMCRGIYAGIKFIFTHSST